MTQCNAACDDLGDPLGEMLVNKALIICEAKISGPRGQECSLGLTPGKRLQADTANMLIIGAHFDS
jgi:hypothetical protein